MAPILLSKKERKKENISKATGKRCILSAQFSIFARTDEIFLWGKIFLHIWRAETVLGGKVKFSNGCSGRSVSDGVCLFELSSVGKKSFVIKSLSGEEKELIDRHLNTAGVAKSLINCHLRRHLKMHSGEKSLACSFCCCSDDTKTQPYQSKYERNLAKKWG